MEKMIASHTMPLTQDATQDVAAVPAHIQLLPPGAFTGRDGRGPYRVSDMTALIQASMGDGPLIIDEGHATDLGAISAPAFGRIIALFGDENGLWGEVQWNKRGTSAVNERDYWGISPVFEHDAAGAVKRLLRASLTNIPNLPLIALNQQEPQTLENDEIAAALGLDGAADGPTILAAIKTLTDRVMQLTATQAASSACTAIDQAIASGKAAPAERPWLAQVFSALGDEKFQAMMAVRPRVLSPAPALGALPIADASADDPVALGHRAAAFRTQQAAKGIDISIVQAVMHCQTHKEAGR